MGPRLLPSGLCVSGPRPVSRHDFCLRPELTDGGLSLLPEKSSADPFSADHTHGKTLEAEAGAGGLRRPGVRAETVPEAKHRDER